jgi:cytochrome bd-type quinol oxidase subunit 1
MKLLILDLYKLFYRITNNNRISVALSVLYISVLNMVVLYGLGTLLPSPLLSGIVSVLFRFPVYFATGVVMILINLWIMSPLKNLKKERKNRISYWGILMYTGIALIFILYTKYGNNIMQ